MKEQLSAPSRASIAPGEGERRAQRGYVLQYDLGARVVYEALASGRLRWIGVADRSAGIFDDIVIGLHDRIVGHQLKTSRDPVPFNIRTVLLGSEGLWALIIDSWRKLRASHPNTPIEVIYACDDYPRIDDDIAGSGRANSSAAFLRTHDAHRLSWALADWHASPFSTFLVELQAAAALSDQEFEEVLRQVRFLAGGQAGHLGLGAQTTLEQRRLQDVAALLPRLVADPSNRDRWQTAELLSRLGWRDPFELRHGHAFPVDALYQTNARTQHRLQEVLASVTRGYVGLVGPPGSGKSTLLAAGLLPTPRAAIARYLAFVPNEGHGLGRAEAEDFLQDIIAQFKHQGLGAQTVPGSQLAELRHQFVELLREASERFRSEAIRTLVVVDGLDHVPREERPAYSFLRVLPLPHAVPDGIIFILGTQRLELDDLPPEVSRQAAEQDRQVTITPLSREAVALLANAAGIPRDVNLDQLFSRTDGHPLSIRYVVEGLRYAETPSDRQHLLQNGPTFGGDVNSFYERAWHGLGHSVQARRALVYVALSEGPLHPNDLVRLVGDEATDAAWHAAKHLLVRDYRNAWSIFHNSFRLFVRDQAELRHGLADESRVRRIYAELADMAAGADLSDPQHWMELRYSARAGDHARVAALARPERFRAQFAEGREPGEIQDDIGFALRAAGRLRSALLVVDLILIRHELNMRCDAIGDDFFDALIQLGDRRTAGGLIEATGVSLTVGKGYELVDAFLVAGEGQDARRLFEKLEPIEKLLGSERIEVGLGNELQDWAERALVFRAPEHFLACLNRLQTPDEHLGRVFDMEDYTNELKLAALRGQLQRDPTLDLTLSMNMVELSHDYYGILLFIAARSAFFGDDDSLAIRRLEVARGLSAEIEPWLRREFAALAARIGQLDLAGAFFEGIAPPALTGDPHSYQDDDFRFASKQIINHAVLAARLGRPRADGAVPQSRFLATYQDRLQTIGTLHGEGRRGERPSVDPHRELRATLNFLQYDKGDEPHDTNRWRLDRALGEVIAAMVNAAGALGSETLARFTEAMDERLAKGAGRLGRADVRRAYSMAVFRHDFDATRAALRLARNVHEANTPSEEVAELALTASSLAAIGFHERARGILAEISAGSVGYSRPARKDAQYAAWRELLRRACDEDPLGRPDRLRFFARLLTGMSLTEGDNAGRRLVPTFLNQAAQVGVAWMRAAADRADEIGLVTWSSLVEGVLSGIITVRPDLSAAAGVIIGRISLPFAGKDYESKYADVVRAAPLEQLDFVVRHSVSCIEADSHPERRILLIEEVVEAAADRGLAYGTDALSRWRAELPPPRSGNSPEDPFFLVRTLEEISLVLQQVGNDSSKWGAVRAFERIAPRSNYDLARAVFDGAEVLRDDGRAIETMGRAAFAAGREADATACLARLKQLAGERGAWGYGGYTNDKLRYHKLNVLLNGEVARRSAFDAFVGDLADRRESVESLLPEIDEALDLHLPRPTWAQTWACIQDHLAQFREYRIGRDVEIPLDTPAEAENTLADILFRAFDTTAITLGQMARTAAIELAHAPGGPVVVAALVPRLWRAGGHSGLEAIQIAWECRDANAVRDAVMPLLVEMCAVDDLAISRTAMSLARAWGQRPTPRHAGLPLIYRLQLPPNPQTERFEPPSGVSSTSSGLYTDDPYSWTWVLERPLRLTAEATGIEIANLRARAAQFMTRIGGANAFGPDAIDRQQSRLGRLSLHLSFRKLPVGAAFQAMREVAGELAAAEAIDTRAVPLLLLQAGAFHGNVSPLPPVPRPRGVSSVRIPDLHRHADAVEPPRVCRRLFCLSYAAMAG